MRTSRREGLGSRVHIVELAEVVTSIEEWIRERAGLVATKPQLEFHRRWHRL